MINSHLNWKNIISIFFTYTFLCYAIQHCCIFPIPFYLLISLLSWVHFILTMGISSCLLWSKGIVSYNCRSISMIVHQYMF